MAKVGIRELKTRASEIVREVREHQASYVVTRRGEPVVVISPYDDTSEITSPVSEYDANAWEDLFRLGEQVTVRWSSPKTSAELLSEMRR